MVDQQPQGDARSVDDGPFADAMRDVAQALREVAGAIRDSAAIVELVPCEDGDCIDNPADIPQSGPGDVPVAALSETDSGHLGDPHDDPADAAQEREPGNATVLPLIPTQNRGDSEGDAATGTAATTETLCRPGGCGCSAAPSEERGRHARPETPPVLADPAAESATALAVAAAVSAVPADSCSGTGSVDCSPTMCDTSAGF